MIRQETLAGFSPAAPENRSPVPWERAGELGALAFASLWTTGPDPGSDAAFRLQALRRDPETGAWEAFETACATPAASARMVREYGVTSTEVEGAPPAEEAFAELTEFLRGRMVIVPDRASFASWTRAHRSSADLPFQPVDLGALAGVFLPGRLASAGEELSRQLLGDPAPGPRRAAIEPTELRTALGVLVGRILDAGEAALALLASAYLEIWRDLRAAGQTEAARELAFLLRLCEHPSTWRGLRESLYPEHRSLSDGRLSDALRAYSTLDEALEAALPRWAHAERGGRLDSLGVIASDPISLDAADRRTVDEIFQEHLPRHYAELAGAAGTGAGPSCYREGQHDVARHIAERFGQHELFLVHAPTGTGKTLAYLVPTMLWAFRQGIRVGIATYTRALQEQAMEREVPLARALLARAGVGGEPRVSVLKGRQNYVCWRALRLQDPEAGLGPEERLAWTTLVLFALTDPEGDLDRFPRRAPLEGLDPVAWRAILGRLLRAVRAETGCCSTTSDRATCAAEASRHRAERAHVVLTNHAFALSRREFFRHLVFDECEHLHGVAHDAFSHAVGLGALEQLLDRFHTPGVPASRPLDRVLALAVPGSGASVHALEAVDALALVRKALRRLRDKLAGFKAWRDEELGTRQDPDRHSLFREYVRSEEGPELLEQHAYLLAALHALSLHLAQLAEYLDSLKTRALPRIRRALEVLRGELGERTAGVEAWIPRDDDAAPAFRAEVFYDLETTARGEDLLVARVLLPHEVLGRHYLPDLRGAVFLSATTWLQGGFAASSTYLGLQRAAQPLEDEEREPCIVRTLRAPDAFDYRRVLIAVPKDAPPVRPDKTAFLRYVERFVAHLTERTRGRCLVLFTNAEDAALVGGRLSSFYAERRLPFWYQRMDGTSKEELSELFRTHTDSVLFGLDTFWYGADFPGPTLEYLVLVRLPYGVPDRYHQAQCAVLGNARQRKEIYLPRALAKFRQGFGRLMRKETDRGCVFVLDNRILDPRHRVFLKELPTARPFADAEEKDGATLVVADTDRCLDAAFAHMEMKADIRRRGLDTPFGG